MLPMFLVSGHKNYFCEAVILLLRHHYILSPRLSSQILWSKCVNVNGRQGKNIPGDLYMEHLNRIVKDAVSHLGPNQTKKAIQRIGKAIGTIAPISIMKTKSLTLPVDMQDKIPTKMSLLLLKK